MSPSRHRRRPFCWRKRKRVITRLGVAHRSHDDGEGVGDVRRYRVQGALRRERQIRVSLSAADDVPATSEQSANVTVSVLPSADVTAMKLPPTAHGIVTVPAAVG